MTNPNFKKKDVVIIVLFFVLYGIGYAWLIEPKDKTGNKTEKESIIPKSESRQTEMRQLKSLSISWPDTCEQYERELDEASYYQDHYDEYQVTEGQVPLTTQLYDPSALSVSESRYRPLY